MWSKTKPLLSLWQYSQILGINPFIFAQIGTPSEDLGRIRGQCETVFYQSAAQYGEHLSRDDIAQALVRAQNLIAKWQLTYPAPKQILAEQLQYPRPHNFSYEQLWRGASRRLKSVTTTWGNIFSTGVWTLTEIETDVAVTLSDPYGDGFDTYFSASVTVPTGTGVGELKAYFSVGDRYTLTFEEAEIQGFQVSISGTTATLSGSITLLVQPALYLKLVPDDLTVSDATNYVTTIDVYRQTVDLSQSGTLLWDNEDCGDGNPCTASVTTACFKPTDTASGYLQVVPATWDADTSAFVRAYPYYNRAPDRVQINYISGVALSDTGLMRDDWAQATAMLATAIFPQSKICGCTQADTILFFYRQLPVDKNGTLEISQEVMTEAAQVFGSNNRGACLAYIALQQNPYRVYRSVNWNG